MAKNELEVPDGISLVEFLKRELQASTLSVISVSKNEILIEADPIVRIHVKTDEKSKTLNFDFYSPRWSRQIAVQQFDGFDFMESRAEELMEKENVDAIAEDSLLALDMIRLWAVKNKYESSEVEPSESQEVRDASSQDVKSAHKKK